MHICWCKCTQMPVLVAVSIRLSSPSWPNQDKQCGLNSWSYEAAWTCWSINGVLNTKDCIVLGQVSYLHWSWICCYIYYITRSTMTCYIAYFHANGEKDKVSCPTSLTKGYPTRIYTTSIKRPWLWGRVIQTFVFYVGKLLGKTGICALISNTAGACANKSRRPLHSSTI